MRDLLFRFSPKRCLTLPTDQGTEQHVEENATPKDSGQIVQEATRVSSVLGVMSKAGGSFGVGILWRKTWSLGQWSW